MSDSTEQPEATGHVEFAASAFHRAWELIELDERTEDQVQEMIDAAHASAWHWRHRDDRTPKTDAVSAWQLSRVYALAGEADAAATYGMLSLQLAEANDLGPFYEGYGHEALARAAAIAGEANKAGEHAGKAADFAASVSDAEDRALLEADLETLR